MLPSEMAMRKSGWSCRAFSCDQSATPCATDNGMVEIQASIGDSMEECGAGLPLPICSAEVMSVSARALKKGAQYSLWMLGSPCTVGFSFIDLSARLTEPRTF